MGSVRPSGATEAVSISRGSSSPCLDVYCEGHLICLNKDFSRLLTGVVLKGLAFRRLCSDGPVFRASPVSPRPSSSLRENNSVARDTSERFRAPNAHGKSSVFLNFSISLLRPIPNSEASEGSLGQCSKAWFTYFSCPECFQGKFIASVCNKIQQETLPQSICFKLTGNQGLSC